MTLADLAEITDRYGLVLEIALQYKRDGQVTLFGLLADLVLELREVRAKVERLEAAGKEIALDYQDMEKQAHAPLPGGVQYANDPGRR